MTQSKARSGAKPATQPAPPPPADREEFAGQQEVLGNLFPPALKFAGPGETHVIEVKGVGKVQDRDFDDNELLFWPDGQPKMVLCVYGPADDGSPGSWWVRGKRATTALRDACKAKNVTGLASGDLLAVTRGPDEEIPPPNGKGKTTWANTWECLITVKRNSE